MDRTWRVWSIVALSVLCAVLSYVLLRTPPRVTSSVARSRAPPAPAQSAPAAPQPSGEPEFNPEMYRGWPLFFGWPLPEVPFSSDEQGTGGSKAPDTPERPTPP